MTTLYDLLGALPDDDAETLRASFLKAVKTHHPDNNPNDPDAPKRFRRIVRANAILRDERQRREYDRLLKIALKQRDPKPAHRPPPRTIRSIASGVIALSGLLTGLVGVYLLVGYVSNDSPKRPVEEAAREPLPDAAAIAVQLPEDTDQPVPPRAPDDAGGTATKDEKPESVKEATASEAPAPTENTGSIPAGTDAPRIRDYGVNDARYYRERGAAAYHNGNLDLALVDFDLAIDLDPNLADAYIDRGIVRHRLGDIQGAFADVAEAKRIDDANRSKSSFAASRQPTQASSKKRGSEGHAAPKNRSFNQSR